VLFRSAIKYILFSWVFIIIIIPLQDNNVCFVEITALLWPAKIESVKVDTWAYNVEIGNT